MNWASVTIITSTQVDYRSESQHNFRAPDYGSIEKESKHDFWNCSFRNQKAKKKKAF